MTKEMFSFASQKGEGIEFLEIFSGQKWECSVALRVDILLDKKVTLSHGRHAVRFFAPEMNGTSRLNQFWSRTPCRIKVNGAKYFQAIIKTLS